MKFKCSRCGYSIATIREEHSRIKENDKLDDFPPNSEIWDKDWRLYCFYGVNNIIKDEFSLVCCNCGRVHGPQRNYNKLVNYLQSLGILYENN